MGRTTHHFDIFDVAGGFCGIAWSGAGIGRFLLPAASAEAAERTLLRRLPEAVRAEPPPDVAFVIADVRRFFAGERVDFTEVALDLSGQESFSVAIYAALRRVGWGETTTYGALAKAVGAGPEAARAVGQAMGSNPVPLIIPCHRVLAAGGRVGGFSAPGGAEAKVRMLRLEGVRSTTAPAGQGAFDF